MTTKKKPTLSIPSQPRNFAAWCREHNVTLADISAATGVGERQARRYLDGDTPIKRIAWEAVYRRVMGV